MAKNRRIMYAIALLQGMVFYGPIATLYRQAAGLTILEITVIESISLVLILLLELPWGYMADRLGYRRTIITCSALFFLSKVVFWRAEGMGFFLLERVLLAVVGAGLSGVESSILYLSCPEGESQKVFGQWQNCQHLGLLFAAGVFGLFVGERYRLAAFLTVVSYALAALLSLGLTEVKGEDVPKITLSSAWTTLRGTVTNKRLMALVLGVALAEVAHQMITVFIGQLKYVQVGMGSGAMAAAYMVMTLCGLSAGASHCLTDRFGGNRLGLLLFMGAAVSCLLLAAAGTPLWAVVGVLGLRLFFSLLGPLFQTLENRCITSADRATALSAAGIVMDVLVVLAQTVMGKIANGNLGGSILLGAGLCLFGGFLYWLSWKLEA